MRAKLNEAKKGAVDASDGITGRTTDERATHYSLVASDGSQNSKEREAAMLFSIAEEHIDEDEDYDKALKAAEDAAKCFEELGNTKGLADTLRLIIHALAGKAAAYRWTEKGNHDNNLCGQTLQKAEERAQGEFGKFKEAGDKLGQACMQLSLAELGLHDRGAARREESLEQATQAEALFRELGATKLEADTMYMVASILLLKGSAEEAVQRCEGALAIYRDLAARKEEAKTSHLLACALGANDQFKSSMAAAKDSLKIFREIDAKKFVAFELFCIAGWHVRREEGKEALSFAKESLALFQELGYGRGWQAGARDMVVEAQLAKGDKKQALKLAKEGVDYFEGSDDKRSQIFARKALVRAQIAKDNISDALLETETALEATRELDDKRWESSMLNNVAEMHIMNKSYDQASSAVQEAQQLLQDVGDKEGEALVLDTLNLVHREKRDFKMAAQVAGEQRDLYTDLGDKYGEARTLLSLSEALANEGKLDEALASATESQAIFQERNNRRGEGSAWNMIALIHQRNEMNDLALQAHMKMQALFEECDDKKLQAMGLKEIAQMHLRCDEPDEALKAANQARALAKKSQNRGFEVEMLVLVTNAQIGSLMKSMMATGKPPANSVLDKAMKAPKEAVLLAKKTGDKGLVGYTQLTLSQMYLTQGRFDDALKVTDDASKNLKAKGDELGEVNCIFMLAQVHYQLEDFAKASELCNKAMTAAQACGDPDMEQTASNLLAAIQERQGGGQQRQQYQEVEQYDPQQGAQQQQSAAVPQAKPGLDPAVVTKMVKETLAASMGTDDDVDMDTPLMEAGMDSLSMVAFRNQLQRESGISMPASVMFDYPSMSGLVDHLVDSSRS